MKTPLWESSPGALVALLNSGAPLVKVDLYTLTLQGGAVLRWSGSDVAVTGNGNTWALGPGLERTKVKFTVGIEVDTLTVTVTDVRGTQINGAALVPFIARGGLNGSRLQLDRAFWTAGDTAPRGALLWFAGRLSEIPEIDRYSAQITIKSDLELLDVMVPLDVFQAGCLNTVYDTLCGADRAAKTVTGTVSSAGDARRVTFGAALAQPTGYYDLGVVKMTSGPNAGLSRTVKAHVAGSPATVSALQPWPFAPAVGDAFAIVPGCDKSQTGANGCPKFHDAATVKRRFRGYPFVPTPETVA